MNRPILLLVLTAALFAPTLWAEDGTTASPASNPPAATDSGTPPAHAPVHDCVRETGSLIQLPAKDCSGAAGDAYDHSDLETTGESTVGGALGQLDPRISVRGH